MKTKFFYSAFLIILIALSCKKDEKNTTDNGCGVEDPLTELDWLADIKQPCDPDAICNVSIFQGSYQNQTVFYTFLSGPLCDPVFYVALMDCQGNVIKEYRWENLSEYEQEVDSVKTLYMCNEE